ncbi:MULTISPECIES: hypothetical protein [unclassified Microbacterium]|uniref:hypothetical protein n=1 Tax=unclassified Microbacterium TaxID=2609290 RepID=UPI00386E5053
MSTQSGTTADRGARARIGAFTGLVWVAGLLVAGLMAWIMVADGVLDDVSGSSGYSNPSPWEDEPVLATDLGGGLYEGRDGAMIPLTGVDISQPIVLTSESDTTLLGASVTGPGGEILTRSEYDSPPDFDYLEGNRVVILVEHPDVELWVDAPRDETWRARVSVGGVPDASLVESGFESAHFLYRGPASSARFSGRGDGSVIVSASTVRGSDMILAEDTPLDQTLAWPDSSYVLFSVEQYGDAGWRLEFPPDDGTSPTPSPTATPAVTR